MTEIDPTVGRVVHYYPDEDELAEFAASPDEPLAAHVAAVHDERCVNLMVVTGNGKPKPVTSVLLVQPDDDEPEEGGYCRWMDYQIGQAERTEQAEAK